MWLQFTRTLVVERLRMVIAKGVYADLARTCLSASFIDYDGIEATCFKIPGGFFFFNYTHGTYICSEDSVRTALGAFEGVHDHQVHNHVRAAQAVANKEQFGIIRHGTWEIDSATSRQMSNTERVYQHEGHTYA